MTGRIRLTTGLILFVFVAGHLLNHILGLHSLAAMEAGRDWFILIWRNSCRGGIANGVIDGPSLAGRVGTLFKAVA